MAAFRQGLAELGFQEGQNISIEYRWAEGHYERLPVLAKQLAEMKVAAIAATGGPPSARAAISTTSIIPIVFTIGGDPTKLDIVSSFSRPGGNVTGISFLSVTTLPKQFEILREAFPGTSRVGLLVNRASADRANELKDAEAATGTLGQELVVAEASTEEELGGAFNIFATQGVRALVVPPDAFFNSRPRQIIELVARSALPAIYGLREYVDAGGLMSYGTSLKDAYRKAGNYVGRILKGEKPGELPVQQAVKVELVVNLKAARTLGLAILPTLLARADELIE